ncbi:ABC transporter substrate-binding protein [Paenibacillus methanolicus]|uniref:ABC-type glycerol-3-phosphate transport system substrate-binding protein n=1 Tax=Paenibacillus methanolicus TaxID=582686 RepID=A0A5S5CF28_9BACL|nr:extracellular solute-binding protein [Paenibacillus methanolicus]TYP77974.1 ABC-type glycerol-3-phosphate transport system substrate-binding protein [Paenibacillus methanolicus]
MSRRKVVIMLLGVFTASVALLFPMFAEQGLRDAPSQDEPNAKQQAQLDKTWTPVVRIRVEVSMTESEFEGWRMRNERFNANQREVEAELVNQTREPMDAWQRQAQLGQAGDIYMMDNGMVEAFAVQGYLRPLDDYYTGERAGEILKAFTGSLLWNGSLWGVPLDGDPALLVWNKELMQRGGHPEPPSQWPAFTELAEKLVGIDPDLASLRVPIQDGRLMLAWLSAFEADRGGAEKLKPLSAEEANRVRYLAAIPPADVLPYGPGELEERFRSNKLLAAPLTWSEYVKLTPDVRRKLVLGLGRSPAWTGGRSFVVSSLTTEPEAALAWIKAMTEPSEQLSSYAADGRLPAEKTLYRSVYDNGDAATRPPQEALLWLEREGQTPDPLWWARLERWLRHWSHAQTAPFTANEAERLIQSWNQNAE